MEAVIERKKSFRSTLKPVQEEEVLTYETLQQHKREQQRLIAAGIIKKTENRVGIYTRRTSGI